jgi:hypothetical protein
MSPIHVFRGGAAWCSGETSRQDAFPGQGRFRTARKRNTLASASRIVEARSVPPWRGRQGEHYPQVCQWETMVRRQTCVRSVVLLRAQNCSHTAVWRHRFPCRARYGIKLSWGER